VFAAALLSPSDTDLIASFPAAIISLLNLTIYYLLVCS
jgi:hypothetical protein